MSEKFTPPWQASTLADWSIVGMNHYHVNGERRLFVAMTKGGRCIVEEGPDDQYLWNRLMHKVWKIEDAERDRITATRATEGSEP